MTSTLLDEARRTERVVRSMCSVRTTWLAGNAETRGGAVQELRNLRRHSIEIGLHTNTDLVAVMDRLLVAMAEGDASKVRTIPEGGGCGAG